MHEIWSDNMNYRHSLTQYINKLSLFTTKAFYLLNRLLWSCQNNIKFYNYPKLVFWRILTNSSYKLDDSAFLRTQSYITEICYFEFLWSFEFWLAPHWDFFQKIHLSTPIHIQSWPKSSLGQFKHCSESLI